MCVVAITWPHKKYQNKTLESIETQFSAFDGVALQDFTYDEFNIVDHSINDFVYADNLDDRFSCLIWAPLKDPDFWRSLREYDPEAILKLQGMFSSACQ